MSHHRITSNEHPAARRLERTGGVFLGVGLGGFFDGIVLHQILQWHHLVSERVTPDTVGNLQLNTLADGLFHAVTWTFTVLGALMLWAGMRRTASFDGRTFAGTLLIGWGVFNVVEGLVSHQILGVHHVRPGPDQLAYDLAFLAWGAAMLVGGALMTRRP